MQPSRRTEAERAPIFEGVFLGGFECSCQKLRDGRRLDLVSATRHDAFASEDYRRLAALGMTACRDGSSWVRVEQREGRHDFSSVLGRVRAAERQGLAVVWDLLHFGWPDDVDVFATSFPGRFARYARAFARFLDAESERPPMIAPINEISYLAWAAGDVRCLFPFEAARGFELKVQLVRAALEAIDAIRAVLPRARFLQPEPVIHIVPREDQPKTWRRVESDELLQYQAWDMLTGRVMPSLGGDPSFLDLVGVNFYPDNQFTLDGATIGRGSPRYKPFSRMLREVWDRYRRPMIVSETGAEGDLRAPWLAYVADECVAAIEEGVELDAVTLYPVLDHPGWEDDRHCPNGLFGYADERGHRDVHAPLAEEIARQTPRLAAARAENLAGAQARSRGGRGA